MVEQIALANASKRATVGGNNFAFKGNTATLAILDKFERQENLGWERKQKVKANRAVREMQDIYREFLKVDQKSCGTEDVYALACQHIKPLLNRYTARDIHLFSITLVQFEMEKEFTFTAGFFLSALINESNGKKFAINTENLSAKISRIGYNNTKNVVVDGNVGNGLGCGMVSGKIRVNGNAEWGAGYQMDGGEICVNGNAGEHAGREMNGKVSISGDAGKSAGHLMRGGVLAVGGKIGSLGSHLNGGDIFEGSRQIVKDGKDLGLEGE